MNRFDFESGFHKQPLCGGLIEKVEVSRKVIATPMALGEYLCIKPLSRRGFDKNLSAQFKQSMASIEHFAHVRHMLDYLIQDYGVKIRVHWDVFYITVVDFETYS